MMAAAALYLGLMMVAIIYFSSFRVLGWSYTPFAFTFVEFGFIYVLMLGTPWMVRTRGHVYIELLTAAVPDGARKILSRVVASLCVLVCLLLAYYTGKLAWSDFIFNEYDQLRADLDIPRWVVSGAMPLGFGLMSVEFFIFVVSREPLHSGQAGVVGEEA
jgi:C4-dicarboxylate transporter DctQ subunit